MHNLKFIVAIIIAATFAAATTGVHAQTPGSPISTSNVPVRELSAPEARSERSFGSILGVRTLPGEKLLLNDPARRQLLLLDSRLKVSSAVLDSNGVGERAYGRGLRSVIPYLGDSTLVLDAPSYSLIVIHPNGTMGRTMAVPVSDHISALYRDVGIDANGDLIYKLPYSLPSRAAAIASKDTVQIRKASMLPDSIALARAKFATRSLDTIGNFKSRVESTVSVSLENGNFILTDYAIPVPTQDDIAVLSDGSIMFVRGYDYHVDVVEPDGSRIRGPRLPFAWKRLTEEEKQRVVDSAKISVERLRAMIDAQNAARSNGSVGAGGGASGGTSVVAGTAGGMSLRSPIGGTPAADAGQRGYTTRLGVQSVSQVAGTYQKFCVWGIS